MSGEVDGATAEQGQVEAFLDRYLRLTGRIRSEARKRWLDDTIQVHENNGLGLAEKVAAFKRLSPRGAITGPRRELRLQRLLLSVAAQDLPRFKFALDHDGDYKDLEEYLYHDIDDEELRAELLAFLGAAGATAGLVGTKVLSDVDDTLYANLVDRRYPKGTFYPGVLELYAAIAREPFPRATVGDLATIPLVTLSARPNPIAGTLEEGSLSALIERTGGRLRPSALSGRVVSSAIGTLETLSREQRAQLEGRFDQWLADVVPGVTDKINLPDHPDSLEQEIGRVKFNNFRRYASIYPEYRYVFFGDSGQADALTADLMVRDRTGEFGMRVAATFIHDLRVAAGDAAGSPSFRAVDFNRSPPAGSAPILLFRNHIDAAVRAHRHSSELLSATALADVTRAALGQLREIDFSGTEDSGERLRAQFGEDARTALGLLRGQPDRDLEAAVKAIDSLL